MYPGWKHNNYRPWSVVLVIVTIMAAAVAVPAKEPEDPLSWRGTVVSVVDGDSLMVLRKGKRVKVRLNDVDCPERGQPYGREAKAFVTRLCLNKKVHVENPKPDKYYQRIRAKVILNDGRDLGMELVKEGLAWRYRRYSSDPMLMDLESYAKANRLGLWSDAEPTPPWRWRKQKAKN